MNLSKFKTTILIGCLIFLFIALSLVFRIVLPYEYIFSGDWIKYTSNDAYYFMRLVDTLVHSFPHFTDFDPYFIYPGGTAVSSLNFYTWFMAGIIWLIGLGSPSQHTVDTVAVFIPSVMAALAAIPVFFIGKALFNRWAGIIAAGLFVILPGEFMGRTILGANDMPAPEVLFSTTALAFLIIAILTARQRQMTFNHIKTLDRKIIFKPLLLSLLGGIFMGCYLITWQGALLFVFIITLFFVIQFISNHFRHKSSEHLGIIGGVFFFVSLLIYLPLSLSIDVTLSLIIAVLAPPLLALISRLFSAQGIKSYYYPLALAGIVIVFLGILYGIAPNILGVMVEKFASVFTPGGSMAATTMEMQPFLSPQGNFSTAVAWGNFTTSFFLVKGWPIPGFALISFLILIWLGIKQRGDKEQLSLFIIWTLIILVATLAQRRFAYYLVVNVALLSTYISWQLIWHTGLKKLAETQEKSAAGGKPETAKARTKKPQPARQGSAVYYLQTILAIFIILFFVCFWNITKSVEVASKAPFAPSDGWEESLHWMKDNTPDPMGEPGAYYDLYGLDFKYPASAYSVTAWWDYGYWISRTAHRFPSANPSQDPGPIRKVASLFLTTDKADADNIMAELESSYIIADYELATSKFWAVADWAGYSQDKYFSVYYITNQGVLQPVQVFKPDYYRTLVARLYNFNGKAVTGGKPFVVTYEDKTKNGVSYKQVTNAQEYPSYQAAQDYIAGQKSGKYDIVGINPFVSPVPLEATQGFQMVYSSMYSVSFTENSAIPEIKIFQFLK